MRRRPGRPDTETASSETASSATSSSGTASSATSSSGTASSESASSEIASSEPLLGKEVQGGISGQGLVIDSSKAAAPLGHRKLADRKEESSSSSLKVESSSSKEDPTSRIGPSAEKASSRRKKDSVKENSLHLASEETKGIKEKVKEVKETEEVKEGGGKMVTVSGAGETVRKAVLLELMLTLVGVVASSAALYFVMKRLDPNAAQAKIAKQKKKEIARRLGRPMIQTNQYEDIIACDVINPAEIDVTFKTIGGLDEVKDVLHELIILPLIRPELFSQGKLLRPQKGVLLYGPPGTGKTLLAKAVARECSAAFINVRVSSLMSKWFGDAQKLVTAVFTLAHKLQPSIIFIDEIDSILGQRKQSDHEAITSMKTEFMSLWDGFCTDENARVMVLCATNRPWDLDEAILRRLPRSFEIPLPDQQGRAKILSVILRDENLEDGFQYSRVAAACEGYSGSDLMELCKQAAYLPLRRYLAKERRLLEQDAAPEEFVNAEVEEGTLTTADFLQVLEKNPPAREAAEEYRRRRAGAHGMFSANNSNSSSSSSGLSPQPASNSDDSAKAEQFLRFMALLLKAQQGGSSANGSNVNGSNANGSEASGNANNSNGNGNH